MDMEDNDVSNAQLQSRSALIDLVPLVRVVQVQGNIGDMCGDEDTKVALVERLRLGWGSLVLTYNKVRADPGGDIAALISLRAQLCELLPGMVWPQP